jgi:hypothetical protein
LKKALFGYRIHSSNDVGKPGICSRRWFENRLNLKWAQNLSAQNAVLKSYIESREQIESQVLLQNAIGFLTGEPRATLRILFFPQRLRANLLDESLLRISGLGRMSIHFVRKIW